LLRGAKSPSLAHSPFSNFQDSSRRRQRTMLTIRKLSIIIAAIFLFCLYLLTQSPSSPTLLRRPHAKAEEETRPVKSSPGKTKDEIEKILESADRPLRSPNDFDNLRDHLEYLFPYEGAAGTKFPAYIWQTWKYTPAMGEFDERFRMTEASWTERHPDYIHEVPSPHR
jgi:alpha 1,6-mannosyltransferase